MERRRKEDLFDEEQFIKIPGEQKPIGFNYIEDKLKELEIIANVLIEFALWRLENNRDKKDIILSETREWMFQRIGQGSIGPATAAADPLLRRKISELEAIFE